VEPVALTGVYKNMSRGIVALVFRCKVAGGQLTANDEVTGFRWADEDQVREETGLAVEPVALTGVYKNMSRGIVALVFRCKVAGGQLTANDEVTAFQWADEDQVRELLTDAYAVRVTDALHTSGAPAIRQHDGTHLL